MDQCVKIIGQIQKTVAGGHVFRPHGRPEMIKILALAIANKNVVAAAVAALADKEQIAGHRIGHGHQVKTVDSFFPVIQAVPIITMFFYVPDKI